MVDLTGGGDEGGTVGRKSPGFRALTIHDFSHPAVTVSYEQACANLTP